MAIIGIYQSMGVQCMCRTTRSVSDFCDNHQVKPSVHIYCIQVYSMERILTSGPPGLRWELLHQFTKFQNDQDRLLPNADITVLGVAAKKCERRSIHVFNIKKKKKNLSKRCKVFCFQNSIMSYGQKSKINNKINSLQDTSLKLFFLSLF